MWLSINDMILSSSNSIRSYSYLVKKVVFPVDIIPVISIISSSVIAIFLFIISIIVCSIFGFLPNILMLIYMFICLYALIFSITRITSALTTLVPDFGQLLNIFMQLFFWFTPIIWNLNMLDNHLLWQKIFKSMPFTYLVTGFRQAFTGEGCVITEYGEKITFIFWAFTIIAFVWGNHVFKKGKKDFADVL